MPDPTREIRVFVADDDEDVGQLFRHFIEGEPDLRLVGSALHADAALGELRRLAPDVLIIDLNMPGRDPLDLVRELRSSAPALRAIVYSGFDDEGRIERAMAAGACGYLSKDVSFDNALAVVRRVANGEKVILTRDPR